MHDDNELLTEEQTAQQFGLSVATLRNWRAQRRGPLATKIGRRCFYRRAAINSWLQSREGAQRAEPALVSRAKKKATSRQGRAK